MSKIVEIGDLVKPRPLWNKTERHRKLPEQVLVIDAMNGRSQTGLLLLVEFVNGSRAWLDSAWFTKLNGEDLS